MTENEIIKKVLAGDIEHYGLLVDRYQRDVIRIVSAMLFCRQESEDLVQKSFVIAYEKLDRFDPDRDFGLWLKGITRNTVRMHVRKGKTTEKHLDDYRDWVVENHMTDDQQINARNDALARCRSKLSEQQQMILKLRYHDRLSMSEIAQELDRSKDAVTKALSRLRADLKLCINRRMKTG